MRRGDQREDILPFATWPQMSHSISLPQLFVGHLQGSARVQGQVGGRVDLVSSSGNGKLLEVHKCLEIRLLP